MARDPAASDPQATRQDVYCNHVGSYNRKSLGKLLGVIAMRIPEAIGGIMAFNTREENAADLEHESRLYELIDTDTEEDHGSYATLDEARAAAKYDRIRYYAIWRGSVRIEAAV